MLYSPTILYPSCPINGIKPIKFLFAVALSVWEGDPTSMEEGGLGNGWGQVKKSSSKDAFHRFKAIFLS